MKYLIFCFSSIFFFFNSYAQQHDETICPHLRSNIAALKHTKSLTTDHIDITYNRIELEAEPGINHLKGAVTIYFIKTKTETLELDFIDHMTVDSVIYQQKQANWEHKRDKLTITSDNKLNQIDSIQVYFHGKPERKGSGSFRSIEYNNGDKILWTLSEPYGARDWWPCKQSLTDKIDSIDIIVTTPSEFRVASNGLLVQDKIIEQDGKEMRINHWKHRYPITPYLVAIAISNYEVIEGDVTINNQQVPIINYVYPDNIKTGTENIATTAKLMQLYSKLFIPYPFANEKYGHAQFGWGGGMEHQTMSFMVSFNTSLVAHELAHQWFGNHVTCGSWSDLWLNEGFATYLEGMSIEHGIAKGSFDEWLDWKIKYITYNDFGAVYVKDTLNEGRLFSSQLTYAKGAYLLHMLRWELGDEHFFQGVRNYLTDPKLSGGYAYSADLKYHLEATADTSLTEFFNDWLYNEGFPKYNIYWKNTDNNKCVFIVHQNSSARNNTFFDMHLPIKFIGEGRDTIASFHHTIDGQEFTINTSFKVEKIEFNPGYKILTPLASVHPYEGQFSQDYLFVYPNPAKKRLTINFSRNLDLKEIAIVSQSGKKVLSKTTFSKESSIEFDINELRAGVYFVVLQTKQGKISRKFVIEK